MEELKYLPDAAYRALARILNLIEKTGKWPKAAVMGLVAMIPKAKASNEHLGQRPITIMPLIYRMWASVRGRQCSSWMSSIAEREMNGRGGGKGGGRCLAPLRGKDGGGFQR